MPLAKDINQQVGKEAQVVTILIWVVPRSMPAALQLLHQQLSQALFMAHRTTIKNRTRVLGVGMPTTPPTRKKLNRK